MCVCERERDEAISFNGRYRQWHKCANLRRSKIMSSKGLKVFFKRKKKNTFNIAFNRILLQKESSGVMSY